MCFHYMNYVLCSSEQLCAQVYCVLLKQLVNDDNQDAPVYEGRLDDLKHTHPADINVSYTKQLVSV